MEAWADVFKEKKLSRQKSEHGETIQPKAGPTCEQRIKSDLYHTLLPIYPLSLIFGLLPIRFSRQEKTGKFIGRVSYWLIAYGAILLSCCLAGLIYGVYRDLRDGWQNSARLSSRAGAMVTCGDIFAVTSILLAGMAGSPFRWHHLQRVMDKIVDIDDKLSLPTSKNLLKLSIVLIVSSYSYLVTISALDYASWDVFTLTKNNQHFGDKGPINYSPIYVMYQVILTVELQYALVIYNIGERLLKLNKAIENLTRSNEILQHFKKDLAATDRRGALAQNLIFASNDIGHNRLRKSNKVSDFYASDEAGTASTSDAVDQLITTYGILCDCITHVSKAYGATVLIGTISCLIHLVITPYLLYNEINTNNSGGWFLLVMQIFWTLFHVYRLLLFVQPCYAIAVKARMTGALVSQALAVKWNPEVKKQLEIFSIQLMQRPVEFTVCGLFYLDRNLVTSIAGTVTTYLVILVQFQTADDTKGAINMLEDASTLLKNVSSFKNFSTFRNIV